MTGVRQARQTRQWVATELQSEFINRPEYEVLYGGSKFGLKALALTTLLPTPTGWMTVGAVEPGDYLLDDRGLPCRLLVKSEIAVGRPVFAVRFDDGSEILTDAEHRWLTFDESEIVQLRHCTDAFRSKRRAQRPQRGTGKRPDLAARNHNLATWLPAPTGTIRTTATLAMTIRGKLGWNYRVPITLPLQLLDLPLPLDPYVLGLWLGDGNARVGRITLADREVPEYLATAGFDPRRLESSGPYEYSTRGLTTCLRQVAVLENKHIPPVYLRASESQRRALLMGLMDTDGTCGSDGRCSFTNTEYRLITGVRELLSSLGIKSTVVNQPSTGKRAWTVAFRTSALVFRLPRKAHRQPRVPNLGHGFRAIVAIEERPTEPVQCLMVDSPSHLFLAGETMIPTHNTDALLMWSILRRQKYAHSRGLFIRREITELTKQGAAWDRVQEILGRSVTYNQTEHRVTFPNGSVLEFGHCHDEGDKFHYQGAQYDDECFDQLEQFTETQYTYICAACRVPADNPPTNSSGNVIQARIRASANPGDVGHTWVKARFVDVCASGQPYVYTSIIDTPEGQQLTITRDRVFIPASVFDSVKAGIIGPEYVETLNALPEPYRSAYLYGLWDVFVGQAFLDFRPMVDGNPYHVIDYQVLPAVWRRVAAHDWGYDAPMYTLWGALDPAGGVIIYRELWARNWTTDEIATQNLLAQGGEHVSQTWADPSIWASYRARFTSQQIETLKESGQLTLSVADQYAQSGWHMQPANNDRLAGKQAIHRALKERPDGVPWLRVMKSCPRLIATMQQIQVDSKRSEDVVTDYPADAPLRDEPYDALRYLVMGLTNLTTMPRAEPVGLVRYNVGW